MDPWYDYLALPIAPLVLIAQGVGMLVRQRALRRALSVAATTAIAAMFVYVATLPLTSAEGANIGAGVLFLWLLVSMALLALTVGRERAPARRGPAVEGSTAPLSSRWAKVAIGSWLVVLPLPFLAVIPVLATAVSWRREPPSRLRWVATGSTAVAVLYALLYVVVSVVS